MEQKVEFFFNNNNNNGASLTLFSQLAISWCKRLLSIIKLSILHVAVPNSKWKWKWKSQKVHTHANFKDQPRLLLNWEFLLKFVV